MPMILLACKAIVAVTLLTAGGAKLADLPGFAAGLRLFAPRRTSPALLRCGALAVALGEIAAGAASLSSPRAGWLNEVILAICCAFVAVSVAGWFWHPGRVCRCFGALSRRSYSLAGIGRAALLALLAGAAIVPVRQDVIQVGLGGQLGLLAGAVVLAAAAWSASAAIGAADSAGRTSITSAAPQLPGHAAVEAAMDAAEILERASSVVGRTPDQESELAS